MNSPVTHRPALGEVRLIWPARRHRQFQCRAADHPLGDSHGLTSPGAVNPRGQIHSPFISGSANLSPMNRNSITAPVALLTEAKRIALRSGKVIASTLFEHHPDWMPPGEHRLA